MDQSLHARIATLRVGIVVTGSATTKESGFVHIYGEIRLCVNNNFQPTNRVPIRVAVSLLSSRVAVLSQHIRNMGSDVPVMTKDDQSTLRDILHSLGIACDGVQSDDPTINNTKVSSSFAHDPKRIRNPLPSASGADIYDHLGNDLAPLNEQPINQTPAENAPEDSILVEYDLTLDQIENGGGSSQIAPNDSMPTEQPDTDSEDEVTNQLAYRLGCVQKIHDGQLRYFGPTSNLTLLDLSVSIGHSTPHFVQRDAQDTLNDLKLNIEVEEVFEKHLLELYFAWQDSCLHVVHSEIFWNAKQKNRKDGSTSPFFSRALCDAM